MAVKKRLINDNLLSNEDLLTNDELAALEAENKGTDEPAATPAPKQEPAPKPVTPATPAPAEPAQQQPEPVAKPEDDRIPKPRFNEVISERNELRAQVKDLTEKWARFDERKKLADEAVTRFNEEKKQQDILAQRPDETIDPAGARIFDIEQAHKRETTALNAKLAELEKGQKAGLEQQTQFATQQRIESYMTADIARVRQAHPDYDAAAKFASEKRMEFWQQAGYSPEEAAGIVNNEALAVVMKAAQSGQSAAEQFYNVATMFGYQPQNGNGNGGAQPTATPAPAKAKLEQIRAGQSMQGLGGNTPRGGDNPAENLAHLSALDLANMDEELFIQLLQDPAKARAIQQSVARQEGLIE